MPELDAADAYEVLMEELSTRLPELHAQVTAEVERGREVKASEISRSDMSSRNRELASQQLSRLSDTDLAVVELTPEERLFVLISALAIATDTYNASVEVLTRFAVENDVARYEFASPASEGPTDEEVPNFNEPSGVRSSRRGTRSFTVTANERRTLSRENLDAVIEALDGYDEYN